LIICRLAQFKTGRS